MFRAPIAHRGRRPRGRASTARAIDRRAPHLARLPRRFARRPSSIARFRARPRAPRRPRAGVARGYRRRAARRDDDDPRRAASSRRPPRRRSRCVPGASALEEPRSSRSRYVGETRADFEIREGQNVNVAGKAFGARTSRARAARLAKAEVRAASSPSPKPSTPTPRGAPRRRSPCSSSPSPSSPARSSRSGCTRATTSPKPCASSPPSKTSPRSSSRTSSRRCASASRQEPPSTTSP